MFLPIIGPEKGQLFGWGSAQGKADACARGWYLDWVLGGFDGQRDADPTQKL